METFDISWSAILKLMLAGAFTYVVMPALLVLRDLVLHFAIGKWILTDHLSTLIRMCENDRWFLNNRYNRKVKVTYGTDGARFEIDGSPVSREEFNEYEKGRNFHAKRFEYADSKITFRHNLITWLTKHYKQAEGGNPIPELREFYYETAGASDRQKA